MSDKHLSSFSPPTEAQYFRLVLDNVTDYALFSMVLEGRVATWNIGAQRILGFAESDILGQSVDILYTPEDRQAGIAQQELQTATIQGRAEDERWHIRKDGSRFWASGILTALYDAQSQLQGYVKILRDFTVHKQSEEFLKALKQSEERFRVTFEQAAVGMAHVGLDGRWLRVNATLCQIVGYSPEELHTLTFADITHPDDLKADWNYVRALLAGELATYDMEKRYLHKSGAVIWVNLTVALVRDDAGQPCYFISAIEDISRRKALEEAAARDKAHIEALYERLQWAMTETHHRTKNNLQLLSAMMDMMKTERAEKLGVEDLDRVIAFIRSMAAIHDILTHESRDYGQVHNVSSKEFLGRLVALLEQTAGEPRHIQTSIQPARLSTRQATSLALIVNELVANAFKHAEGEVEVSFEVQAGTGQLRVCDNGPGFPPAFHPLASANTGIELVEMLTKTDLNGQALYTNRDEGGACVTISLPLAEKPK